MLSRMPRRRCDPLADKVRPHWLIVADLERNMISCDALPAGTNLRRAMRSALDRLATEGWQAESDGAYGFTFIAHGQERRLVNLTPADPTSNRGAGYAFLAGTSADARSPR